MKPIGIIANPRSGKDIRRLVACGSVFSNLEKINILKRVLLALDALNAKAVVIMPDLFEMGRKALEDIDVALKPDYLDMNVEDNQDDSTRAAALMAEKKVACIVTLGGDGTNRAVAKTCRDVPLLPISTGTNNVFPFMIEGTLAGIAAGLVALGKIKKRDIGSPHPKLEIYRGTHLIDIALVDAVVSNHDFIGTRAIYDVDSVQEIFLTRAEPNRIGFSAVGGFLDPLKNHTGKGMHIVIGKGGGRVLAPIAPGMMKWLPIQSYRTFNGQEAVLISHTPSCLALDGERELHIGSKERLNVRLNPKGPTVVNIERVLQTAQKTGLFLRKK